jgi:hypothetical protein
MQVSSSELLRWTIGMINSGGESKEHDFKAALKSAVINKRLVDLG